MWFGILTLLIAISIAGVAAWFSIAGLVAIFSASAIAIAVMASALEIGKLVAASWLYRNWKTCGVVIKLYLVTAVVILMVITSMGIFGFLSKAHLDQAGVTATATAGITRIDEEISRKESQIRLANTRLDRLLNADDAFIDASIQQQQALIRSLNEASALEISQYQNQINQLREQLQNDIAAIDSAYNRELESLDSRLESLDAIVASYTSQGTTRTSGGLFSSGDRVDNVALGNEIRQEQQAERDEITAAKDELRETAADNREQARAENNARIDALMGDIARIQSQTRASADQANAEIRSLRQTQNIDQQDMQTQIVQLNNDIDAYHVEIEAMNAEKFNAELHVQELELEVGPIKYVADLVYGDRSEEQLDRAVRLFIIMLVIVFDPLAVMLLLAANITFRQHGIDLEGQSPVDTPTPSNKTDKPIAEIDDAVRESPVAQEPARPVTPFVTRSQIPEKVHDDHDEPEPELEIDSDPNPESEPEHNIDAELEKESTVGLDLEQKLANTSTPPQDTVINKDTIKKDFWVNPKK